MSDLTPISELLLHWHELRQGGRRASAEELCGEKPELAEELQRRIDAFESMEALLGLGAVETIVLDAGREPPGEVAGPPSTSASLVLGYEILGVIDQGGMGVVYQARQKELRRVVALKMIAGPLASAEKVARFRTEAEAIAHLQHPGIVQIYDVGEVAGRPFFSMEFVPGGTLKDRIAADAPATPRQAAELVEKLARAVCFAHQRGIVHRDLKPANVLITSDGEPKLTDFGLAKRLDEDSGHTRTGEVLGTLSYMAPEQAQGQTGRVGPPADVYALGAILYELLTGRPPLEADNTMEMLKRIVTHEPPPPSRTATAVPRDLEAICLKCLEKDAAKRYADAQLLADDLRRFLDHQPVVARRVGVWGRTIRWIKRHPQTAALLALPVMAVMGLAIAQVVKTRAEKAARRRAQEEIRLTAIELAPQAREILKRNCVQCHGQDDPERELRILDHDLLLGKRELVVPGFPADSLLIKRIEDGSMPPEDLETTLPRLSQVEVDILTKWIIGGAPPFPEPDPRRPTAPAVPTSPLALEVKNLFVEHCYTCHKVSVAKGGIKILHHRLLVNVRKVVVPGDAEDSELLQLIIRRGKGKMPPDPRPPLSAKETETIRRWINEGAPPFPKSGD